jgi:sporulation protein YlmC with PRC-barrel domain
MIRKLMASSAILALMTAGTFSVAQAQTDATQNQEPAVVQQDQQAPAADQQDMAADSAATTEEGKLQPDEPTLATAFIGRSVFSSEDPESDNIGEVNDLIVSDDGTITHAVVGVGGFLGIGEKDVAVPFEELEVVERDGDIRLVYAATREQLEAAEEFDRTAYDPGARFAEEQAAMQPAAGTDPAGGMAPVGGMAPAPTGDIAAAPSDTTAPGDQPAPADTAADTTDAGGDTVSTAEESEAAGKNEALVAAPEAEQSGVPAEDGAESTAAASAEQETDQTEQDLAAATEQPAETAEADQSATDQPAETAQADQPADAAAGQEQPADATQTAVGGDSESQFLSFNADQVRASTLMGKEIFGPDDQSIGEVSDLVLQKDGETRAALIDVGGFLGVGEKEIAIPFEQIEVQQSQDQGGEPRLTIAMSREELEQLPAFEDNTMGSEETAATEQPADQNMTAEQPADQAAAPAQPADQQAADATQQPADQNMAADQAAQPADQTADAAEQAPPPEDVIAGAEAEQLDTQGLSAEDLIGTAVYGPDDQTVGEVGDVIFGEQGDIEAVVIDVGGFLGIGEKPVAVQFDALNVQKDQNGDMTLSMDATQEQLENAPAYNQTAENQQQPVQ